MWRTISAQPYLPSSLDLPQLQEISFHESRPLNNNTNEPSHKHLRGMHQPGKMLVQMSGAPGSGKSTVANLLARSIDGIVIDHDRIRSFLLDEHVPFAQSAKLAYRFQWTLAEDMIKQGRTVIIDSTCNYAETLDQGIALGSLVTTTSTSIVGSVTSTCWSRDYRVESRCEASGQA